MADIVNLRRARKRVERMKRRLQATENATKYGRTKADILAGEKARETAERHLDQHRRDPEDGPEGG